MSATRLCTYRYDPLDRLTHHTVATHAPIQRFYCKSRLATEIEGLISRSIIQHDDQLLALTETQGKLRQATLLATDQQRSVLRAIASTGSQSHAYTPYGNRTIGNGLLSLLGFNGQRPDSVTGHYLLGNGHRAFNPVLMRFNSPDKLSPFGAGGLNAYAYCGGDPINRIDPNGRMFKRGGSFLEVFPRADILDVPVLAAPVTTVTHQGRIKTSITVTPYKTYKTYKHILIVREFKSVWGRLPEMCTGQDIDSLTAFNLQELSYSKIENFSDELAPRLRYGAAAERYTRDNFYKHYQHADLENAAAAVIRNRRYFADDEDFIAPYANPTEIFNSVLEEAKQGRLRGVDMKLVAQWEPLKCHHRLDTLGRSFLEKMGRF